MPRPRVTVPWRLRHPQLSVSLPVKVYAALFIAAKARGMSAAALARDVLERALQKDAKAAPVTPAGALPVRDQPMREHRAVAIPRALPQLRGLPVGVQAWRAKHLPDEE